MQNTFFTSIGKWLEKPLPFYESYRQKIAEPILLTTAVMLGILILTPSQSKEAFLDQLFSVLRYGGIIIFVSLFFSLLLPELFPKRFSTEKWIVKKTLVLFLLAIFTVTLCITLYAYYFDNPNSRNFSAYYFKILLRSIILSFFPIILIVFYRERTLYRMNQIRASQIIAELRVSQKTEQHDSTSAIYTFAENTNDEISVSGNDLLYFKAEGNYCQLVYLKGSDLSKQFIRSSLKDIEHIIRDSGHFYRCHKSYIINLNKIEDVTGNARGYTYCLHHDCKIPSSRNVSKSLINELRISNVSSD